MELIEPTTRKIEQGTYPYQRKPRRNRFLRGFSFPAPTVSPDKQGTGRPSASNNGTVPLKLPPQEPKRAAYRRLNRLKENRQSYRPANSSGGSPTMRILRGMLTPNDSRDTVHRHQIRGCRMIGGIYIQIYAQHPDFDNIYISLFCPFRRTDIFAWT